MQCYEEVYVYIWEIHTHTKLLAVQVISEINGAKPYNYSNSIDFQTVPIRYLAHA